MGAGQALMGGGYYPLIGGRGYFPLIGGGGSPIPPIFDSPVKDPKN